jgi:hypothetical protein
MIATKELASNDIKQPINLSSKEFTVHKYSFAKEYQDTSRRLRNLVRKAVGCI